jgi:hypothetical protein
MYWNGSEWGYSDAVQWHTTDNVKFSFVVVIGDMNNTAWDFNEVFTVSTTPN